MKLNKIFSFNISLAVIISILYYSNSIDLFTDNVDSLAYRGLDSDRFQYLLFLLLSNKIFGDIFNLKLCTYLVLQLYVFTHLIKIKLYSLSDLLKFLCVAFSLSIICVHFAFIISRAGVCLAIILITSWSMKTRIVGFGLATLLHYKTAPLMALIFFYNWCLRYAKFIRTALIVVVFGGVVYLSKYRGEHLFSDLNIFRLLLLVIMPMIIIALKFKLNYLLRDFMFNVYIVLTVFFLAGLMVESGEAIARAYAATIIGYYFLCGSEDLRKRVDIIWALLITSLFYIRGWENFATKL